MITIFTPTFNRAYIISKLYESLLRQTYTDFEWIVVDDGSTDDTGKLLTEFIVEKKISIRYVRTENGGKHRAINKGVALARGELFFIVDSDDYLTDDALKAVHDEWRKIRDKQDLSGLCFRCISYNDSRVIGEPFPAYAFESDHIEIAHRYKIFGDKAEIFRTDVLRQFPFPEIPGENFIPEALIWCRMSKQYKILFIDRGIYMCEYLPDGLSKNFLLNLKRNPKGFRLFYREQLTYPGLSAKARFKARIRLLQCIWFQRRNRN